MQRDYLTILKTFQRHDVEFIVVGAMSAVLQGSALMTLDLDVVHRRDDANITRLMCALGEMSASYRGRPELAPTRDRLVTTGHQLLRTDCGPLDVLGAIEQGLGYDELIAFSHEIELGLERPVLALSLAKYIELKELAPREKDRARLPELRATALRIKDQG
jgi:hypothetical protein